MSETNVVTKGLREIIAFTSKLSFIDGLKSTLIYRGYDIRELAENSLYEEIVYLLWYGDLPSQSELDGLRSKIAEERPIPDAVVQILKRLPGHTHPMDALRTGVSALSSFDPELQDISTEATIRKSVRLLAKIPTLVTVSHRIRNGYEPIEPRKDLTQPANYLYMLQGHVPSKEAIHAITAYFVMLAEHEINASTFAARVATSTLADIYSSVIAAISTLKGPLHGGAAERVLRMLDEIGSVDRVDDHVMKLLANGERVMGFGHGVYRSDDPRAVILRKLAHETGLLNGDLKKYDMSVRIDEVMTREKNLKPNVDFYSAALLDSLGITADLFTPTFVCSRIAGWTAHIMEQLADNRLIRPRAEYEGPRGLKFVALAQR